MQSIKQNYILNSANQMLSIFIPLITTPYLSRILGAEMLGFFSYANSVAYYFTLFGMLGLSNYGGREIAKARSEKQKLAKTFSGIYYTQLISSITVSIVYIIYAMVLQESMAFIYIINVISVAFDINWLYFGLERFDVTLRKNFFVKLITTVCIFCLVKQPKDVYAYALIMALGSFGGNIFLWIGSKQEIAFVKVPIGVIKKHFLSNFTLFLPVLLTSVYRVMDKLMIRWMSNYSQVGYYENADKFGQVPLFLISSLSQIMIPRISYLLAKDSESGVHDYLYKSFVFISVISTTIIMGIVSIADEFVPLYFGKGYDSCINLIRVILPSYIFTGYAATIRSQMLIPYGKDKEFAFSLAVGACTNLILNMIMIPKSQALGAAIATAITEIVVFMITVFFAGKDIKWGKILKMNASFYVSGLMMIVAIQIVRIPFEGIPLLVSNIVFGAFVYCVTFGVIYLFVKVRKNRC